MPTIERKQCGWEICLDTPNADKWVYWSGQIIRWADDTWTLCKPEEKDAARQKEKEVN